MAAQDAVVFRDAYLRWLISTGFDVFPRRAPDPDEVGLIVEWKDIDRASVGWALLRAARVVVPAVYADRQRRIGAFSMPREKLGEVLDAINTAARRVELASPVSSSSHLWEGFHRARRSRGPVFAAVLDDGCAFANQRFVDATGTRIVWLWDQGERRAGRALDAFAGRRQRPISATDGNGRRKTSIACAPSRQETSCPPTRRCGQPGCDDGSFTART